MTDNRKMITIRMEPGLHKRFKGVCSFLGVKMQDIITDMILRYTDNGLSQMVDWAKARDKQQRGGKQ